MEPSVSSSAVDGRPEAIAPAAPACPEGASAATVWREVLRWSLPALLIGLALRAVLMWSMPHGYVQYDSCDYLVTAQRLIEEHRFFIHSKRSYLTPMLFTAAFALPVPALITIAVAQHFLGLIATLLVGALVRFWFRSWKVMIIPVTVLFAANPFIIWYEHTIMGEAQFLFFTLVMVFAGTLFARQPTTKRFIWFIVSLLAAFGTRLESKTFLLFAVLLVVVTYGKQWRKAAIGLATVIVSFVVAFHVGGDRDVSSLVYASLIRFAPTQSRSSPDLMPLLLPIRETARARSVDYPSGLVRLSKQINLAVDGYVAERVHDKKKQGDAGARIVRNLCLETLEAEPVKTLLTPWTKFHLAIDAWSSYCWDKHALWVLQPEAMTMKDWMTLVLGRGLTGQSLTLDNVSDWVRAHYQAHRVLWFTGYQEQWNQALIFLRLPDRDMADERWVHDFYGGVPNWLHKVPGIPFYYIIGFIGMLLSFLRPGKMRGLHFAWVATVLGGIYVCSMVGVTNGRFRFVYEPFFLLYFFLFFDAVAGFVKDRRQSRKTAPACST
jgi:hypothetical protein